jgi:hypothetical protein
MCQHSSQQQGHLRVVRGLPGDGIPGTAIRKIAHAIWVFAAYCLRELEFNETAQRVSRELAEQAALSPFNLHRIPPKPLRAPYVFLLPSIQDQWSQLDLMALDRYRLVHHIANRRVK